MRDVGPGVTSTGVGPIELDVEMARKHGWSETLINQVAFAIGALSRQASYETAFAKGYTYKCLVCECWTVQPPARCHLCHADEYAADKQALECSCPTATALNGRCSKCGGVVSG